MSKKIGCMFSISFFSVADMFVGFVLFAFEVDVIYGHYYAWYGDVRECSECYLIMVVWFNWSSEAFLIRILD